jgi:hypothetical protein
MHVSLAYSGEKFEATILEIQSLLNLGTLYANEGNINMACSSAYKAITVYKNIDPKNDLKDLVDKRLYADAGMDLGRVSQSLKRNCY